MIETVTPPNFSCLSGWPDFTAFISVTMGQILMKLGENFGTSSLNPHRGDLFLSLFLDPISYGRSNGATM